MFIRIFIGFELIEKIILNIFRLKIKALSKRGKKIKKEREGERERERERERKRGRERGREGGGHATATTPFRGSW